MKNRWVMLIPAYQPTAIMLDLLKEAKETGFEIVVVNDGSSEDTLTLFEQATGYATVLRHQTNMGKGCALKTGLRYIFWHFPPNDIVVTIDADGQHKIKDAANICTLVDQHPDCLILGSRRQKKNVPLRSRFGNTVTRFIYRLCTGLKVHDTQTGLRAFSGRLIPDFLEIPGERYEYEMNVLLACPHMRIPIQEAEIETIYADGNASSHFDPIKDSYRIYKEILKFSASSLISFLADYALYSLFTLMSSGLDGVVSLTLSNIGARIISATINYTLNRKLVFQSNTSVKKSAIQYFLLASLILAGNTLLLYVLADVLSINRFAAKLCVELLFFIISWIMQRCVIFKKSM